MCKENKNNDFIQQFLLFRVWIRPVHDSTTVHACGAADAGAGREELLNKVVIFVFFAHNYFGSFIKLKGWLTGFFLGLIVFMGCGLACVHACFFLKRIIFHIIYLYSTPLCPFSDKRLEFISWFYEAPPSEIRDGLRLVSWLSVLWFAKPPLLQVWTSRPSPQPCAPVEL